MKAKKALVGAVALASAALACFGQAHVAIADPVSNSYAIVGSDTLEDVVNAIVNGTDITGSRVRVTQNGATLASFDATGSPYIITKPGGVRFGRPNGSGDGRSALTASTVLDGSGNPYTFTASLQAGYSAVPTGLSKVNITDQVDIARSSSYTTPDADPTKNVLTQIPFGRDAIAVAVSPAVATYLDANGGRYITKAELQAMYSSCGNAQKITHGSDTVGIVVNPVIPQSGSGTRKDFLKKAGVDTLGNGTLDNTLVSNDTTVGGISTGTAGGCILTGQEHDATALAFTANANAVMPMSASRWIAMKNGASFDKSGNAVLVQIVDSTPYVSTTDPNFPVNTSNGKLVPGAGYYADSVWGRDTYLIVNKSRLAADTNLAALFAGNKLANVETSLASKVGMVKKLYGFLAPVDTTASDIPVKYSTQ